MEIIIYKKHSCSQMNNNNKYLKLSETLTVAYLLLKNYLITKICKSNKYFATSYLNKKKN